MKLIVKIALGIILALVLLVAGCGALLGAGVSEAQKQSDAHAITPAQFRQVKQDMTLKQVKGMLGAPSNTQEYNGQALDSDCIYYNQDGELASLYQFCFHSGKLSSKASY